MAILALPELACINFLILYLWIRNNEVKTLRLFVLIPLMDVLNIY